MNALLAKKGDNVNLFTIDNSRLSVMNYGINLAFDQFYNGNTGECYFNTPEFIQFLELVKTYPEEVDGTIYDSEDFWINYENQWRNGETILKYEWIYNFMNYVENSQGYFGEPISYIGFPTTEGSGSAAYANFSMAISEESAFKEEAWDFISYFMKDEYQDTVTDEFPIKLSSLNKKAEEERTPETWIDEETGEEIVETPSYWLGEEEIELKMPTEEECQYVIEFLKNIDYRQKQIEEIKAIIEEDSAAFFEGEKSAQQVADTIQSRVKIYVSEKR
jgi:ABC-type glycerol-3-phosphate transport system substrate-binding protein